MLSRGGLAVQEIQIPSIITLTMMAAVITEAVVTEAVVTEAVVIIDLDMMRRSQPPLALRLQATSRVGGGSALVVRRIRIY